VSTPSSGRIEAGRHILPLRIYYEDTDAQGIVYYANWLRFLERGRTELLRLIGSGIDWIVRRCTIDYLKPARLDEVVDIVTACGEMRGASLDMIQQARRGDELLVSAELLIACMGAKGRPARLPAQARTALQRVAMAGDSPRSRHIRI
jgi:acyl-CoA thioester hydrolase